MLDATDTREIKDIIREAIAEIKMPEITKAPVFDDSNLKAEIAELKAKINSLQSEKDQKAKPYIGRK